MTHFLADLIRHAEHRPPVLARRRRSLYEPPAPSLERRSLARPVSLEQDDWVETMAPAPRRPDRPMAPPRALGDGSTGAASDRAPSESDAPARRRRKREPAVAEASPLVASTVPSSSTNATAITGLERFTSIPTDARPTSTAPRGRRTSAPAVDPESTPPVIRRRAPPTHDADETPRPRRPSADWTDRAATTRALTPERAPATTAAAVMLPKPALVSRIDRAVTLAVAARPPVTTPPTGMPPLPPTVQVTIGRVEVRAQAQPPNRAPRESRSRIPRLSLEDYLRERSAGG